MVDASYWSKGRRARETGGDFDEFFASAYAAYSTDETALRAATRKAARVDPRVKPLAARLMKLLAQIHRGEGKGDRLTGERKAARQHVKAVRRPNVGDSSVGWLLKLP
jgi:hypothetical protein